MGNSNSTQSLTYDEAIKQSSATSKQQVDYIEMNNLLETMERAVCNVAVVGLSGSGKSMLINTLRGVCFTEDQRDECVAALTACTHNACNGHEFPAPTGYMECTTSATPYSYGDLRVYDLPGYGTKKFSPEAYYKKFALSQYDAFIFLTQSRLQDHDILLAKHIKGIGKPYFIVHSKFDQDLDHPGSTEASIRASLTHMYMQQLNAVQLEVRKVYFVSCQLKHRDHFDFNDLQADIVASVPEVKRHALMTAFRGYSASLINAKYRHLQGITAGLSMVACTEAGAFGLVPAVGAVISGGADVLIIYNFLKIAKRVYNINDNSFVFIKQLSPEVTKRVQAIEETMKKALEVTFAASTCRLAGGLVISGTTSFVPVIGAVVNAATSVSLIGIACHQINTSCRDAALAVTEALITEHVGEQ